MKFSKTHIIGHRGAKFDAPENSLGGFEYLRAMGIHNVEIDAQLTRDGQVVVFHDDTLEHLCNIQGHIGDYDVTSLQAMNCAANFKHWPHSEPIPTLEQVLSAWPALSHIQIEIKTPTKASQTQHAIETLLVQINRLIKRHQLENIAVITAKNVRVLELNLIVGKCCAHGLVYEPPRPLEQANPITLAKSLNCEYLIPYFPLVTPQMADDAQAHDIKLSAWTVNDPEIARHLIEEINLDSVITDKVRDILATVY